VADRGSAKPSPSAPAVRSRGDGTRREPPRGLRPEPRCTRPARLAAPPGSRDSRAVPRAALVQLRLAKEDFAFAAAHFTLFPDTAAERLHGHNYRVRVELAAAELDGLGFLVPVAPVKARVRAICATLDERILIPEKSRLLELRQEADAVQVSLGGRTYRFPKSEVSLLPLPNVTIEALAKYVWGELAPSLSASPVRRLRVEVEETSGQSAAYEADLG
jgi:6-pyruvoyltetrahydropterin/6-carboxytetrahydropterin synthase